MENKKHIDYSTDLSDNEHDKERMQPEETTFDLPEVKDIPGQEHVHVPPLGDLADVTPSSDDEEGKGLLDDLNGDEDITNDDSNVTNTEKKMLSRSANETPGDEGAINLRRARLDSVDEEGDPLNETGFGHETSGADLDIPGGEEDDRNEAAGAEDEENNAFSNDKNNDEETIGIP